MERCQRLITDRQKDQTMRSVSILAAALACCLSAPTRLCAKAPAPRATIAILDLDYADSSGEVEDQRAAHARRLRDFVEALGRDVTAQGEYRLVALTCEAKPCASSDAPADIQRAARAAGARFVVTGGVHKMSTLVQWAKITIADMERDRVVLDRLLTFRNDSDESWRRAEHFVAQDITSALASALDWKPPVKLAVFPFELEDFSGGGGIIPESPEDAEQLRRATETVRNLIARSGRFELAEVDQTTDPNATARELRKCDGCDAAIAKSLGADQSLVGIVTRITRTDYAVTFRLRDARTGEMVSVGQTDLRIGANYSWPRGAAWLMEHRLLAPQNP